MSNPVFLDYAYVNNGDISCDGSQCKFNIDNVNINGNTAIPINWLKCDNDVCSFDVNPIFSKRRDITQDVKPKCNECYSILDIGCIMNCTDD